MIIRLRHFILLLLLLASSLGIAQPRLRCPEIYIGAHAGAMVSSVLFNPTVSHIDLMTSPITMNGGLVFRYATHKVCAIQVEANYMQRGWHETITTTTQTIAYNRTLDYIEIPLLMHLYFGKERFRGFLNLGPQIGYCIRDVGTDLPADITAPQYLPIEKTFDWGLAGGLGCYYRTKRIGLFQLESRFNFSMGTLYGNRKTDYFNQSNMMNLSLNLAYMWEIKLKD